jgi:cell division protein FtsB
MRGRRHDHRQLEIKRQRSDAFAAARPGANVNKPRAGLVMPGRFDAAEMPRLDAFDEEFGQDPVAIQRAQRRKTRERFWTFFSVALGVGVISVLALGWSAADRRLRLELQSAVVAPISPRTREGLEEEIDGLRRQVEALKHEITKLKDAREQTAQTIAALRASEQESRDPVPSTYWYSDTVALSVGIESQPEPEGVVPLPRPPPTARPALRRAEQNRGAFRRKLRSNYP